MGIRKGDLLDLNIEQMAYGGKGVARSDRFVVFVRGGVPGDTVRVKIFRKKKDYAEAGIIELLDGSPDRTEAPCPYHGYCGGCQWQHVKYERQLEYKRLLVEDAMARIGGLSDPTIRGVIPSEMTYGYRNKMEFSFSDRRWLLPREMTSPVAERNFALGLHVPGTFSKVIDIRACLLQQEVGNGILREVKKYVRQSGLPVYGLKSHEGYWRFLSLRHSEGEDRWMVNIVTREEKKARLMPLAEHLCGMFPGIQTVVNNVTSKKAGIAVGEREIRLSGEGTILDRLGPFSFQISANSFFQTNVRSAVKLFHKIVEYADLKGSETVLDLYSGTGTIPLFLSGGAAQVLGMEIEESAVADAEENCRVNGVSNCRFILGDVREKLSNMERKPDVLVIDPPRAGMHKKVLTHVMEMGVDRIVYVSCNPTTMARDLSLLCGDYRLMEIQPVDMFPQTYHIESVAKLVRRKHAR